MIEEDIRQYIVSMRREFHMHPELSGQEEETSRRICMELERMNIPFQKVETHSVIGKLERGQGKKLAIRADMDALPLSELTEVPWKSRNENVMHACGHDGHMASLLGAARLLS